MIVLEWLFLTIAPCDAAEPWQLGSQDAGTPMMQGIMDLHHDIFFFSRHFRIVWISSALGDWAVTWKVLMVFFFMDWIHIDLIVSFMENWPLSVGGSGSGPSSSRRPCFDLNLPPADEPEPEPSPASTPQEGVEPQPIPLPIAERETLARLGEYAPDAKLLDEARAIVRLKGEIVDHMEKLDPDSPEFWREHRDSLIRESIRTTHQREYPSYVLSKKLDHLRGPNAQTSATYKGLIKIQRKFRKLGTFIC